MAYVEVYKNLRGKWRWRVRKTGTNEILATGHQDYATEQAAWSDIAIVSKAMRDGLIIK